MSRFRSMRLRIHASWMRMACRNEYLRANIAVMFSML
jgi:hypothetical protein